MKKVYRQADEGLRRFMNQDYCHPQWQELTVRAHQMSLQEQIDRLVAVSVLDRQQIQILPHQVNAVMTVINKMRTRAILADEVGLGKTIEAGLIIKEYLARGLVKRVLILTPAPLTTQWRGELLHKFGEIFVVADREDDSSYRGLDQHAQMIVSLDTAKLAANAATLLAQPWDLVVVDEAHRLKNSATQSYQFVSRLSSRFCLMLTATPVQNSLFELYNLASLLQEGILGTLDHFRATYVQDRNGRILKNSDHLAQVLAKIMVRNRRVDVGITFASRRVETVLLDGTMAELALHEAVLDYVRCAQVASIGTGSRGSRTLTFIRLSRMMASSPQALKSSVEKLLAQCDDPVEAEALQRVLRSADAVVTNSKTSALLRSLHQVIRQSPERTGRAIVFTSFHETQRYLKAQLEQEGYRVIVFSGLMSQKAKDAAVEAFRAHEGDVLLCTDAGSEGINLQFCHVLINYDLPWNPMRVEQRIGRVHRIGQQRDVVILNMAIRDTVEEYILHLLEQKIELFNNAVGETDLILSNLRGVDGFEKAVIDLIAATREPKELRYQFEAFGASLALAKQAADQIKAFDAKTLALLDLSALQAAV